MTGGVPTGGQYCIAGLVLQLLVGLDRGLRVVIDHTQHDGPTLVAATMVLEPELGGDHYISTAAERLVEQVKIRTNGKAWTPGEIAGDVLPDLAKAVHQSGAVPTRYRLVTDGALNCATLIDLAERLASRPLPDDPLSALDDENRRAFLYGRWLSERGFFEALRARAGIDEPIRFWRLLASFEAEGGLAEAVLVERIDAVLGEVVDAQEDVTGKRQELIGWMTNLAQHGGSISARGLLEQANLPADRLLHRAQLPRLMRDGLQRDLEGLGYCADQDVREPPRAPGGDLLLFSGESGLGKSWRLAALLAGVAASGHLAIVVSNARALDDVRRAIIERVWLSGFDREIDLPGLHRRIGRHLTGENGVWLTVGVDDVQDRDLLNAIHAADWQQYGVRVVATVPVQLADEMARRPRPPAEQRVERFSHAQLRRFLAAHGRSGRDLPDDVAELLCTPIFAELYHRSFASDWRPTNEYELIDGFWRHATFDTRGMADAQDDVVALEQAARQLLVPTGCYPWLVEDAVAAGLGADARKRLTSTGILRPGVAGIAVTHDRVLNWLVARALAADLRCGRRTVDDVVALLARLNTPDAIAPGLAYRLGYVRLDLLWLSARALPPETVHALVDRLLEGPEERINEGSFIEEDLAGLGPPILPTLALIAAQPDGEHRLRAVHAARAIATVGQQDAAGARVIISALLVQTDHALTMGLAAAARLSVPAAIDRLWAIHHERRTAASVASDHLDIHARHDLFDRSQSSFKALKRAMMDQCDWIEARLDVTDDMVSAEILLELLLAIDHGSAREIWQRKKHIFLDRLSAGRTILARAIGRFGDGDEAVRLETESEGAEWLEPTRRFDALLRVAPERAVEQIDRLDADTLQHGWFSVRRLIREGGAEAKARLLARHERGWEAMRDLVMLYWHDVDLIDLPAFDAVVAALENRLAEVAGTEWSPRGEGHLINFLSQTRRPDLLARLTAQRGGRLELLLRDLANDRVSRPSLCVDRDAEQIERLLLLIGGEGYGEMVAHAIRRETVFAREDGYEAALRLPPGSPHVEGLAAAAVAEDRHQRENYDLMLALAAQKLDGALYELIASTAAAYTDALDIRASLGPMDETVAGRIRTDLESPESAVRIGATLALAFAPPSDVADLLAQTLARCPDGDDSSLTVVRIAHHLNSYTPGMLPQLTRMLGHADSKAREAVLPYLAAAGDSEARAVASRHMANESSPVIDHCALKTAFSLSAHEQASGTGIERLSLFVDRHHGVYPVGLIAARLHERDAMSNAQIVELAYTARRLSAQSSAYLIERVAQFDRDEAHGIAERHFAQTPSSSAARQLLTLGGEAAIDHMLQRYLDEEQHRIRWVIARAVRRYADRTLLLDRLAVWTRGNSADRRIAAAELLSWLPGQRSSALLDELARDPVPEVADAALDGIARLRAEDHARTLIGELQAADHLGRWSRLYAIIELVDPYLLEQDPDGLELGAVIDPFGEAFVISAEGAIKKRKDAVQKQAEQLDREARD